MTRTAPPKGITWEFILTELRKQYVGQIYLSNMRREFHNLKQRQMSVIEYHMEFTRLSKYAPEMLVSEEEKCRKFEDGLYRPPSPTRPDWRVRTETPGTLGLFLLFFPCY